MNSQPPASTSKFVFDSKEFARLKKKLEDTAKTLKDEFTDLDSQIDTIINAIRPWYLCSESLQRPIVLGLWGRTGVGKTSLVLRLIELLDMSTRLGVEDLGKLTGDDRRSYHGESAFERFSNFHGKPCAFLFDEIQMVRTRGFQGVEVDRPFLRDFWNLLDTGKIQRPIGRVEDFYINLQDRFSEYLANKNADVPYVHSRTEVSQHDVDFLKRCAGIVVGSPDSYAKDATPFFEVALKELSRICSYSVIDYSRSVIFVTGNLDEILVGPDVVDPDLITAEQIYTATKKINTNDVKKALLIRFRPEQVARLGSTHIVFPGFSDATYPKLIRKKLDELSSRISQNFHLDLSFDQSVVGLLSKEGNIPTQGARPVVSLIGEYIESQIPNWILAYHFSGSKQKQLKITYDQKSNVLSANGIPAVEHKDLLQSKPRATQTEIRNTQHDSPLREILACHEAGHAVTCIDLLGMLPLRVILTGTHTSYGGLTQVDEYPTTTLEIAKSQLANWLGGMAAEKHVFGSEQFTSASSADLQAATYLSGNLVMQFGMSSHVGQSGFDSSNPVYLSIFRKEDDEIREKWIKQALEKAGECIQKQEKLFRAIAQKLLDLSALSSEDLKNLVQEFYSGTESEKKQILKRKRPRQLEAFQAKSKIFFSKV